MPGGLLNMIAVGKANNILNENPSKTFFKCVYAKYTNFGIQKFRIDYNGSKELRLNESSEFTFKIPRYGELLLDNYLAIRLPDIWSPIYPPQSLTDTWKPYEFKWIKNLGTMCIEEITINIGGHIIQKFSGEYIHGIKIRDFSSKLNNFNEMIGNTKDLNEPENYLNREGYYPNSYYDASSEGSEPSIRSKYIYIPLSNFFSFTTKQAFPLVCLHYNELNINIKIRPLKELFTINDITNISNDKYSRIQPNFNETEHAFYRFLQQPPSVTLTADDYKDKTTNFNSDIHLISTYCFLSEDETKVFIKNDQSFLIKQVYESTHKNIVNSRKMLIESNGMVPSWMWYLRRSDSYIKNEWSNYTNYNYEDEIPSNVVDENDDLVDLQNTLNNNNTLTIDNIYTYGPSINPDGSLTDIKISNTYNEANFRKILTNFSVIYDGKNRENEMNSDVYSFIEKYRNSRGSTLNNGLYYYNHCLLTSPYETQPSGAINLTKFNKVEIELKTITPPIDTEAQTLNICSEDGELIGVNKNSWDIYQYTYDFKLFEERYNVLLISNGTASLKFSL